MRRAILGLLILLSAVDAGAQISPGPLSAAHEHLDGVRQCRTCHGGGDDGLDQKCLECHQALQWTLEQGRGLHAREGRQDCARCHPEHAGRDFDLVDWGGPRDQFDHSRAGWVLTGAHARQDCDRCHQEKNQQRNVLLRRPDDAGTETWLGLDHATCLSCHATPHSARIGSDCQGCHNDEKWTEVTKFDHARTAYPLTGGHATLECVACHRNGRFGTTAQASLHYSPIAFDECSACHKDPHLGRFGLKCSGCHTTTSFKDVPADRFEHARTRFPLRDAHARVTCDRCHDPAQGGWGKAPAFDRCAACHQDAHAGTATIGGTAADCKRCHGEETFTRTTFDLAMHAQSDYPLQGRHEQVDCVKCHRKDEANPAFGRAGIDLRPESGACRDCHADDHAGQLAGRYDDGACGQCHVVEGWLPSTFTVARHAETRFALRGAHARTECRRCHGIERVGLAPVDAGVDPGKAKLVLPIAERLCGDCHVDVHRKRYASGACGDCHTQDGFVPSTIGVEEHDRYRFRLQGEHRATPCFLCHKQLDSKSHLPGGTHALIAEPAPPEVVLWDVPSACQGCHRLEVPR